MKLENICSPNYYIMYIHKGQMEMMLLSWDATLTAILVCLFEYNLLLVIILQIISIITKPLPRFTFKYYCGISVLLHGGYCCYVPDL